MGDVILPQVKEKVVKHLVAAHDHLAVVRHMIQAERTCPEILRETAAAKRALSEGTVIMLEGHLEAHVAQGIRSGCDDQVVAELLELYRLRCR